MNLRRRRRVRTLALAAFLLALAFWPAGSFFHLHWLSPPIPGTMPPERRSLSIENGQLTFATRIPRDPGGLSYGLTNRPFSNFRLLPPAGTPWWSLTRARPNSGPYYINANLPLWTPSALPLALFLLTHWLARRPLARARRGLCHACAYNLTSTPATDPCPECGTHRLDCPRRARAVVAVSATARDNSPEGCP